MEIQCIRMKSNLMGVGMSVDLKLFDGMRHDIFHEKEKEVVFQVVSKFIISNI